MKNKVKEIIEKFENGNLIKEDAISQLEKITKRTVDLEFLENYWRSISLGEYIGILTSKKIEDWKLIDDDSAIKYILEIVNNTYSNDGRHDEVLKALSKRYKKMM